MSSHKTVSIYPCRNYDDNTVQNALYEVLKGCGGAEKYIKKGSRVLIKPNMLAPESVEKAVTTHPAVIKAVIKVVQDMGGTAFVGDSPMEGSLSEVARACGIMDVVNETGASLLPMENNTDVHSEEAHTCKTFALSSEAMETDLIINVPRLKTHTLTGLTAAVKNCYGVIAGNKKKYYHVRYPMVSDFGHVLLDLCLTVKPALSILDAVVAMEGLGPRSGRPVPVGALLASPDPVALDAVSARLLGFSIHEVSALSAALERNLIKKDLSDIKITGPFDELRNAKFDKGASGRGWSFLWRYAPAWFRSIQENRRPWPYIADSCIVCGKCVEHCPVKIISENDGETRSKNNKITINYKGCLRCYCCQEICPHGAVKLRKGKPSESRSSN